MFSLYFIRKDYEDSESPVASHQTKKKQAFVDSKKTASKKMQETVSGTSVNTLSRTATVSYIDSSSSSKEPSEPLLYLYRTSGSVGSKQQEGAGEKATASQGAKNESQDGEEPPLSFVLVRLNPHRPPCVAVRLAFLGGTPGSVRWKVSVFYI